MGFSSGTVDVAEKATFVCSVPETGVTIKNTGSSVIYLGGEDVGNAGGGAGYPLDPGTAETFTGARARETPVVPAPPGDMDPPGMYARCEDGLTGQVSYISVAMT